MLAFHDPRHEPEDLRHGLLFYDADVQPPVVNDGIRCQIKAPAGAPTVADRDQQVL
jgi:hypothetical protein